MKQTNTFIVLRDKKGNCLAGYKNNGRVLAYSADWSSDINEVLKIPEKYFYGKDNEKYLAMAKMFDAEPIKVRAEYTSTALDGKELSEPAEESDNKIEEQIKRLLSILADD
ncbi:hypothetical protein [Streptococcus suis]|uniref:hypothetical protein n=1 Tax=Streptococcus suis TaxID=1307 RepID=UPI002FCC2288